MGALDRSCFPGWREGCPESTRQFDLVRVPLRDAILRRGMGGAEKLGDVPGGVRKLPGGISCLSGCHSVALVQNGCDLTEK